MALVEGRRLPSRRPAPGFQRMTRLGTCVDGDPLKAIINLRPASPGHEMGCALAVLPPLCGDLTRGGGALLRAAPPPATQAFGGIARLLVCHLNRCCGGVAVGETRPECLMCSELLMCSSALGLEHQTSQVLGSWHILAI